MEKNAVPPKQGEERVAAALVIGLFVFLVAQAVNRGVYRGHGNDLTIFMYASDLFFSGQNPYGIEWGLLYPLFAAFVVAPLNFLPTPVAHVAWGALNAVLLVVSVKWMMEDVAGKRFRWVLFGAVLAFLFGQVQSNFRNGQMNILVLFCIASFVHFLKSGRRGTAAFFLAAGIAVKLMPVLLIMFLAVNRAWRVIALTLLWVAALVFAVPFLAAGTKILAYYAVYAEVLTGNIAHGAVAGHGGWMPGLRWAFIAGGFIVAAGAHIACNRRGGGPSPLPVLFYLPLLPLAAANAMQPHYLVLLFPVVYAVAHRIYFEGVSSGSARLVGTVAFALLFAASNIANLLGMPWLFQAYVLGVFALAVGWALSVSAGPHGGIATEL